MPKSHTFDRDAGVSTRNKRARKKELSPTQKRKIYKKDMKKKNDRVRNKNIGAKLDVWNAEHLDDLQQDYDVAFLISYPPFHHICDRCCRYWAIQMDYG